MLAKLVARQGRVCMMNSAVKSGLTVSNMLQIALRGWCMVAMMIFCSSIAIFFR